MTHHKIVVAGGTGLIGSHLVPALSAAGHEVVVLSRGAHPDSGGARYVRWDVSAEGPWREALNGAHAVINLCGASLAGGRWTEARKRVLVESRTAPSNALVQACNRLDDPPEVILQASGVNYYGPGEDARDETALPGEDFLAHLATAWEAPLKETLIRTAALRFGVVLSRDGGALPQMLMPFRAFVGGPIGSGLQWLSWIHIRDAVNAIRFAMDTPLVDAVNVCSAEPVRNEDFARIAGQVLHRPALFRVPRFIMETLLGEQASLVCDGVQALPAKLQRADFGFDYPHLREALEDLYPRR